MITSPQNALFRELRSLAKGSGLRKHKKFIISGPKIVDELLRANQLAGPHFRLIAEIVAPEAKWVTATDAHSRRLSQLAPLVFSPELFKEIDVFGAKYNLLLAEFNDLKPWPFKPAAEGLEVLLAQADPSNLGAAIRSACAFGASQIVLLKEAAHPFHGRALRSAAGVSLTADLCRGPSLHALEQVSDLVLLDLKGEAIFNWKWPANVRLLIGEEGQGVPATLRASRLSIPIAPQVESLNASVAAAIALCDYRRCHPLLAR